jgi:hypothetical protein
MLTSFAKLHLASARNSAISAIEWELRVTGAESSAFSDSKIVLRVSRNLRVLITCHQNVVDHHHLDKIHLRANTILVASVVELYNRPASKISELYLSLSKLARRSWLKTFQAAKPLTLNQGLLPMQDPDCLHHGGVQPPRLGGDHRPV